MSVAAEKSGSTRSVETNRDIVMAIVLLAVFAAAFPLLSVAGERFWIEIAIRVMILAAAATSLSLLIGIAGLYSFGHAAYLGIGSYSVGIAAVYGVEEGLAQLVIAIAASGLFALLTGFVALRTRGAHFIMITMAFAQMLYFVMIGLKSFGGDDGLTIEVRSAFPLGIDFEQRATVYYAALLLLAFSMLVIAQIKRTPFGLVLLSAKYNERRTSASGYDPFAYRLAVYCGAGILCALAGFMHANSAAFVSPDMMGWMRSAELMFIVILGGVGAVSGALLGAIAFVLLEELLSRLTIYWHFLFGLFLIAVVLLNRGGLIGFLVRRG